MRRTSALPLSRFAEPLVRAVVEKSQQAGLSIRRQVADFVEEQRAAFRLLDLPRDIGDRARERTLPMPKERTRHQIAGQAPGN